jgi:hypothetical protein
VSSYDRLLWLDDQVIGVYNFIQRMKFFSSNYRNKYELTKNEKLKDKHSGQRCFIIGNGPSIQKQNLTLLKDEWTFCVNYFYRHPQINQISPSYYAIIDPKLTAGEWPLSMLDDIKENCPEATLFLSSGYQDASSAIMNRAQLFEHYWICVNQVLHEGFSCSTDITGCLAAPSVTVACLFIALYMGFKDVYLLGIDCDGIFRDLVDQSSHFYEAKKENIGDNDPRLVVRYLRSAIQGMRGWGVIADKFKDSPHNIVNLTDGGLLNVFPRDNFEKVVSNQHNGGIENRRAAVL